MSRRWKYSIAFLCLLFGIVFLLINPLQNYLVQRQSNHYLTVSATEVDHNQQSNASFDFLEVEEVSILDVLRAQNAEIDAPVIGTIIVPDINLHLPILKGVSNSNLLIGAGTLKEEQEMGLGNYALASHNMSNPNLLFSPLHRSEIGMNVYITDMEYVYEYVIHTHKIIEPTQTEVIQDQSEPMLTLITCNYNGERRLLVQAEFVEKTPLEDHEVIDDYF